MGDTLTVSSRKRGGKLETDVDYRISVQWTAFELDI